jgi:hypothetical protein
MKKLYNSMFIAIAVIGMFFAKSSQGQTYSIIYMDSVINGQHVPYCQSGCDSIKFVPPTGATGISWFASGAPQTQHGDTLLVESGFGGINGEYVYCNYTQGTINISLHALSNPTQPTFTNTTICGMESINLNAGNYSQWGFTQYTWSNSSPAQTIIVGAGNYTASITNVCGTIIHSAVITEFNPNPPNLGPDITTCQGDSITLDPGTGYSNYNWFPAITTDSILYATSSGIYVVQTTNTVGGCVDNDTIQITFLNPPNENIDLVTIDTLNGNNRVTWLVTYGNAATMSIYRELTTNNYVLVGSAPYGEGTWTDTVSSRNQAWRYKIAIIDSCGNEGTKSLYVQSIHTWVTPVVGGGYTVQWTPYEMEAKASVSQYNIYNGSQLSQLNYLTFVSGSVNVYTLSNFVDSIYVVGAQLGAKSSGTDALSNWISQHDALGINDIQLNNLIKVYPTLTDGPINITTDLIIQNITIYNSLGQVVLITKEKNFDISYHGVCFVHITTDKGVMNTKVVIQ